MSIMCLRMSEMGVYPKIFSFLILFINHTHVNKLVSFAFSVNVDGYF